MASKSEHTVRTCPVDGEECRTLEDTIYRLLAQTNGAIACALQVEETLRCELDTQSDYDAKQVLSMISVSLDYLSKTRHEILDMEKNKQAAAKAVNQVKEALHASEQSVPSLPADPWQK